MPHEGEMFGRVIKLVGGDNVIVNVLMVKYVHVVFEVKSKDECG